MLSIQGNVSSKQDIVFHFKEANRSQSINVIIHSRRGKWHLLSLPSEGRKEEALLGGGPEGGSASLLLLLKEISRSQPQ